MVLIIHLSITCGDASASIQSPEPISSYQSNRVLPLSASYVSKPSESNNRPVSQDLCLLIFRMIILYIQEHPNAFKTHPGDSARRRMSPEICGEMRQMGRTEKVLLPNPFRTSFSCASHASGRLDFSGKTSG